MYCGLPVVYYNDNTMVSVIFQIRDISCYNLPIATNFEFIAAGVTDNYNLDLGTLYSNTCTISEKSIYRICVSNLTVPDNWFSPSTSSTLSISYRVVGGAFSFLTTVKMEKKQAVVTIMNVI